MEINSISSYLGLQTDLATNSSETTGEDFKSALNEALETQDDEKLKASCDEMEAYMLSMVFKQVKQSMLSSDEEDTLIPKGDYAETFESTMIEAVAEKVVEAGGIGLSKQLFESAKASYGIQMQMSSKVEIDGKNTINKNNL